MDEEKLAVVVQKYPCLYDISLSHYSDQQRKENAWEDIAKKMSFSVDECKKKWKGIRDNYRKALKNRDTARSGGSTTPYRPIKLEKQLAFLNCHFKERASTNVTTMGSVSNSAVDSDDGNSTDIESQLSAVSTDNERSLPKKKRRSDALTKQNLAEVLDKYLKNEKDSDQVTKFFNSMSETVKSFPKELQIQIKRQVFQIVNDAEASLLEYSPPISHLSVYQSHEEVNIKTESYLNGSITHLGSE